MVNKKSLKNLRPAKKGEIRNPLGGRSHNPITRKIKKLTVKQLEEVANILLFKSAEQVESYSLNKKKSSLKWWLANVIYKNGRRGDMSALNCLLDRMVGKVKDKIEHTGEDGAPITFVDFIRLANKSKDDAS